MAKLTRRTRYNAQPQNVPGMAGLILRGVLVSLAVSLIGVIFLSLVSLATDSLIVDNYMRYIMVGVTVISIFLGSAYAGQKARSGGLVLGVAIGVIYVLISIAFGLEMSQDSISWLVLGNKFLAGIAAGALGGLVGVNL